MNTYLDGEGGVFMEKSYTKIYTTGATVPLKIRPGHFATNHAHINYYIDVTTLKARDVYKRQALTWLTSILRAWI